MPIIKVEFTQDEYEIVKKLAEEECCTVSELVRDRLGIVRSTSPKVAYQRALDKYAIGEEFSLMKLYGDEWKDIPNGVSGSLGREFFKLTQKKKDFEYIGMRPVTIAGTIRKHAYYKRIS